MVSQQISFLGLSLVQRVETSRHGGPKHTFSVLDTNLRWSDLVDEDCSSTQVLARASKPT